MNKAVKKINREIEENKSNKYIAVVGNFLINHVENNPTDSEKLLDENKSIMKSLDTMKKVAAKQKIGSMAVLTDDEGFAVVLKYFGIDSSGNVTNVEKNEVKKSTFDVSIDDFL